MISANKSSDLNILIIGRLKEKELYLVSDLLFHLGEYSGEILSLFLQENSPGEAKKSLETWIPPREAKAWLILPFFREGDLFPDFRGYFLGMPAFLLRSTEGPWDLKANKDLASFLDAHAGRSAVLDSTMDFYLFQKQKPLTDLSKETEILRNTLYFRGGNEDVEKLITFLGLREEVAAPEVECLDGDTADLAQLQKQVAQKDLLIRKLVRSEKRYKKFFDDDITGDFVMDNNFRVIDCNRSFARIFGFPSGDFALGYDLRQLFTSRAELKEVVADFWRLKSLDYYELELIRPDGHVVYVIANLVGILDEEGHLIQVRGYLFDNTPRKHLEKQLRESQKMEGLGRLAGGIAHDFNNLLTVINGYTEIILSEVEDDFPFRSETKEVFEAGLRASELTTQLLAFSRRQVLTPKVLDMNEVVQNLELMLIRLLNENIVLKIQLGEGLPLFRADKAQMEQVILNLVLNARDAMPGGGQITITTSNKSIDSTEYSSGDLVLPGNYLALSITDNGHGMDAETQQKIFDPFFTTKGKGKGTGLGLSMVYGIIEQSGGSIILESELGKGTEFTILMESLDEDAVLEKQSSIPSKARINGNHKSIVLVEDEEIVRDFINRLLGRYNFSVQSFPSADKAQAAFSVEEFPCDLLITDVIMPGMNGNDLVADLSKKRPGLKTLYMSGYTDDEILRHGVRTNQVAFIHKPFKTLDFLSKVKEILDLQ
jgi:two-component system cell cycle sensor histidine kinase/response regulator CckA